MTPGMPSGPTDLRFPIVLVRLLIVLMSVVNGLIVFILPISGMLSLIENIEEK
jgi:hypothetical protein